MLLQVMLKFESFSALLTLELSQLGSISVVGHVPLKFGEILELFGTNCAWQISFVRMSGHHVSFQDLQIWECGPTIACDLLHLTETTSLSCKF